MPQNNKPHYDQWIVGEELFEVSGASGVDEMDDDEEEREFEKEVNDGMKIRALLWELARFSWSIIGALLWEFTVRFAWSHFEEYKLLS